MTFGQLASGSPSPDSLSALEADKRKTHLFEEVDALLAGVLVRSLKSDVVVKVQRGRKADAVSISGLSVSHRALLDDLFAVAKQHLRGAWFLPEKVSLKTGLVNLPSTFAAHPRFASGLAWEERARVALADGPESVFIWAVLEPLFEQLFLPFELRGRLAGTKSREDQLASWSSVDDIVAALGLEVSDDLAIMRYGGGWSGLRAKEQLEAKQKLLATLAAEATEDMARLYRSYRLFALVGRYYGKAKNGKAKRKQVLNRALERTLAGFFGGDWLRFLEYVEEEPHPDEEIAAAIPETKLFVGGTKSAASVAAEKGLPPEEVERALSTYWNTGEQAAGITSPVSERVDVLKAFWQQFDEIHARQTSAMRSLWGLVEEDRGVRISWEGPEWYSARLFRTYLPTQLLDKIERLWGAVMLPRWPDRIVSEISPHALMAETLGPGLSFWHGSALTAWFVCEGPISRTDMAGLATYHQDAVAELERLGCPIDATLFTELRDAEDRLGPAEPIREQVTSRQVSPGITVEMSMTTGSRRSGFDRLRDIITRHRRAWAEQHLDSYLRARWEGELRETARLHLQAIAEKGKTPPPKQFAKHAASVTNHWFGGDFSAFYGAVGEKSLVSPARVELMPSDRVGFATKVFESLGGYPFERKIMVANREEGNAQAEAQDRHSKLAGLAEDSLRFIQLEEALGRAPELKEFGTGGFEYRSLALATNVQQAWQKYVTVIEAALLAGTTETIDSTKESRGVHPPATQAGTQIPAPPLPSEQDANDAKGSRSWVRRVRGR